MGEYYFHQVFQNIDGTATENDTNAQGGIDKAKVMDRRRGPPKPDRAGPPSSSPR